MRRATTSGRVTALWRDLGPRRGRLPDVPDPAGFLLVAPLAFVFVLVAFLCQPSSSAGVVLGLPVPEPTCSDPERAKHPVLRFAVTSTVFFVPPYLVAGAPSVPLRDRRRRGGGALGGEEAGEEAAAVHGASREPPGRSSRVTLVAAVAGGLSLHRVAHGGELPGGVNVAPLFVVAATFASMAAGLGVALLVSLPRALVRRRRVRPRGAPLYSRA